MMAFSRLYLMLLILISLISTSHAGTDEMFAEESATHSHLDSVFILLCASLVLLMQAGFTLVELGTVRAKNCLNVIMKNGANFCLAILFFMLFGFSLMFGKSLGGIVGADFTWLSSRSHDSEIWTFFLFQAAVAAVTATIGSSALAERTRYRGYLIFTVVISTMIYPILGHWTWGDLAPGIGSGKGWLQQRGFVDFAGATVVHIVGGACALAGVLIVGPRKGRFSKKGTPLFIPPHNIPLTALGTFILIFCWFGLTCGSLLEANSAIGRIAVNTLAAGIAGGLTAMLTFWFRDGRAEPISLLNGILGGLVSITACCHAVTPAFAVIIGAIAGLIATFGADILLKLQIDDVVGAIPVHLFNGIWGTIAYALFHEEGITLESLATQVTGAFLTATTAFGMAYLTFFIIQRTMGLRPTAEEEEDGLDFSEHASNAYPDFSSEN